MSLDDNQLTAEIREIKRKSFSELDWVLADGKFEANEERIGKNRLELERHVRILHGYWGGEVIFGVGYAHILVPTVFSDGRYDEERGAVIAMELSRLLSPQSGEIMLDYEAAMKGYQKGVMGLELMRRQEGRGRYEGINDADKLLRYLMSYVWYWMRVP